MLFVDSCDPGAVQEIFAMGLAHGVTTNPLILQKRSAELGPADTMDVLQSLLNASSESYGPPVFVQVPVASEEQALMMARSYRELLGQRICIKVPFSEVGLRVTKRLIKDGFTTNITSLMTTTQAYLAAQTETKYLSLFMGRISDMNVDAMAVIAGTRERFINESWIKTLIIAGSIRQPRDVMSAISAGADIVTASPEILKKLLWNPGTQAVNAEFEAAGEASVGILRPIPPPG